MTQRSTEWRIVPVADPSDYYAAGASGNHFASEAEAWLELPHLAEALDTSADAWTVREFEL